MFSLKQIGLAVAILSVVLVGSGSAVAQNSTTLYQDILKDPQNIELNLRYARMIEGEGNLRRALAAYQRVLLKEPDNAEAQAEVERITAILNAPKPSTSFYAITGFAYHSNAPLRDPSFLSYGDGIATLAVGLNDKRQLGPVLWNTGVSLSSRIHNRYRLGDTVGLNITAGPEWDMGNGLTLDTVGHVGSSRVANEGYGHSVGATATLASLVGWDVSADYTYNNYYSLYEYKNGYNIGLSGGYSLDSLIMQNDILTFGASYSRNKAKDDGYSYNRFGLDVDWVFPLYKDLYGGVDAAVQDTLYRREVPTDIRRRDFYYSYGLKVIYPQVFSESTTLIGAYKNEDNRSNVVTNRFVNRQVSANIVWEF